MNDRRPTALDPIVPLIFLLFLFPAIAYGVAAGRRCWRRSSCRC
jgi:hypothetical protein